VGTTRHGGPDGQGFVFRLSYLSARPANTSQPGERMYSSAPAAGSARRSWAAPLVLPGRKRREDVGRRRKCSGSLARKPRAQQCDGTEIGTTYSLGEQRLLLSVTSASAVRIHGHSFLCRYHQSNQPNQQLAPGGIATVPRFGLRQFPLFNTDKNGTIKRWWQTSLGRPPEPWTIKRRFEPT